MIRRPPRSTRTDTLFPYTTLFRSLRAVFTENATLDASESVSIKNPETGSYDRPLGDAKRQGNSVIAEFIIDSVRGFRTAHQVHTPIIEFLRDRKSTRLNSSH